MKPLSSILFVILVWLSAIAAVAAQSGTATALYGAIGHVGTIPYDVGKIPQDYESWFAIVVVEVECPARMAGVAVSGFQLVDGKRGVIKPSRIVSIEEFNPDHLPNEGASSYWTSPAGTRVWDGTLPAGKTRLRIRAAFKDKDRARNPDLVGFRVSLGRIVITGKISERMAS